jgi:MFS family permease
MVSSVRRPLCALFENVTILFDCFITGTGTLLCAIAPSMDLLIAARAIARIGGGGYVA